MEISLNEDVPEINANRCDLGNKIFSSLPSSSCDMLCSSSSKINSVVDQVQQEVRRPEIPPRNYECNFTPNVSSNLNSRFSHSIPRFTYNGYSPYGYNSSMSFYSPYNSNLFGNLGMNSAYGINNYESRFIRAAEESTRSTFQVIESLTRTINSVGFLMDSIFGSLNTSFQAILSVIENFSQAKSLMKQFLTSVVTLKIFHKFFMTIIKLLKKMKIISEHSAADVMWQQISTNQSSCENISNNIRILPILTFLGLIFVAPLLVSKVVSFDSKPQSYAKWNPDFDQFISLVGVHDFQAGSQKEVSFKKGQQLKMIPPEVYQSPSPFWVLVANSQNHIGFVPRNHVAPV